MKEIPIPPSVKHIAPQPGKLPGWHFKKEKTSTTSLKLFWSWYQHKKKLFSLNNNKFHIPRKILTPSIKAKRNMMIISIVKVLAMSGYGKIVPARRHHIVLKCCDFLTSVLYLACFADYITSILVPKLHCVFFSHPYLCRHRVKAQRHKIPWHTKCSGKEKSEVAMMNARDES